MEDSLRTGFLRFSRSPTSFLDTLSRQPAPSRAVNNRKRGRAVVAKAASFRARSCPECPLQTRTQSRLQPNTCTVHSFSRLLYTVGRIRIPLATEVGPGPGDILLEGDPAPTERGTVRLCGFRHITTSGFRVRASRTSFIAFCNLLHQISRHSTVKLVFDVKRCSPTLFSVLPKPGVVSNCQTVVDRTIYCIKVE